MNPFDLFQLQLDRIKRDLRTPRQTFTRTTNARNRLTVPVEPANLDPGASWHGTAYGYKSKHCRCDRCTRANADMGRFFRQQRVKRHYVRTA